MPARLLKPRLQAALNHFPKQFKLNRLQTTSGGGLRKLVPKPI